MPKRDLEVAIVGAGMSGMLMGIRLLQAGIRSFRIYEKAERVGGTWRENTYPGLTCDVPSYYYSYSFAPKADWSHRFSPGAEIQEYFEGVADDQGLLPYIEFDTEIVSARYGGGRWHLETRDGERSTADVFVMAAGPLHVKQYPDIPGLDSFAGACFHSADWQHDVGLEGKRIGVIGNGSTVRSDSPLARAVRMKSARMVSIMLARIWRAVWRYLFDKFSVGVTEEGVARRQISKRCREHLATVKDPVLREKLTPDYEPGCKRLIMSKSFYPTFEKPNVDLAPSTSSTCW